MVQGGREQGQSKGRRGAQQWKAIVVSMDMGDGKPTTVQNWMKNKETGWQGVSGLGTKAESSCSRCSGQPRLQFGIKRHFILNGSVAETASDKSSLSLSPSTSPSHICSAGIRQDSSLFLRQTSGFPSSRLCSFCFRSGTQNFFLPGSPPVKSYPLLPGPSQMSILWSLPSFLYQIPSLH